MERMLRLVVVASLLLGACGGPEPAEETSAGSAPDASFPITVEASNGPVEIPEQPERIVSISPTATEMLFAIGAGDQVEAVDDQSNYPPEAPTTKLSGFEPNAEAIVGYDPDLVIASDDHPDVSKALEAVDVPFLVQSAAATLEDSYDQLEQLGVATGHEDAATEVAESMESEIDTVVADLPEFDDAPTYYHELDDTYFRATSETFIGQVYGLMGLENIADEAKGSGSGYPQLSAEYIIDADPDLIFLADTKCCGQSAETVAKRPGWDRISAVKNDGVVELDDDIASRWGPRIVDYVKIVAEHIAMLDPAQV
jgi:iron complex transport system substrate-binding protein